MPSEFCARCGSGQLDEFRLLPSAEKRARDVVKKLNRLAARQGWHTFMAGQASPSHADAPRGSPGSPPRRVVSSPMIRGGVPPAAPEFPLTPTALAVPAWPVPSG